MVSYQVLVGTEPRLYMFHQNLLLRSRSFPKKAATYFLSILDRYGRSSYGGNGGGGGYSEWKDEEPSNDYKGDESAGGGGNTWDWDEG